MEESVASASAGVSTLFGYMYHFGCALIPKSVSSFINSLPSALWFSTVLSATFEQAVSLQQQFVELAPALTFLTLVTLVILRLAGFSCLSTLAFFLRLPFRLVLFALRTTRKIAWRITLFVMMLCTIVVILTGSILLSEHGTTLIDTLYHQKALLMPVGSAAAGGIVYVLKKASKSPLDQYLEMAGNALPEWALDFLPEHLRPVIPQPVLESKADVYVEKLGNWLFQKWLRDVGLTKAQDLMQNPATNTVLSFCGKAVAIYEPAIITAISRAQPYLAVAGEYVARAQGLFQKGMEISRSYLPVTQDLGALAQDYLPTAKATLVIVRAQLLEAQKHLVPVQDCIQNAFTTVRGNLPVIKEHLHKFFVNARGYLPIARDYIHKCFEFARKYLPVAWQFIKKCITIIREQSSVAKVHLGRFSAQACKFLRLVWQATMWLNENRRPVFFAVCVVASTVAILGLVLYRKTRVGGKPVKAVGAAPSPLVVPAVVAGKMQARPSDFKLTLAYILSSCWLSLSLVCCCGHALCYAATQFGKFFMALPGWLYSFGRRVAFIFEASAVLISMLWKIDFAFVADASSKSGADRIAKSITKAKATTTEDFLASKRAMATLDDGERDSGSSSLDDSSKTITYATLHEAFQKLKADDSADDSEGSSTDTIMPSDRTIMPSDRTITISLDEPVEPASVPLSASSDELDEIDAANVPLPESSDEDLMQEVDPASIPLPDSEDEDLVETKEPEVVELAEASFVFEPFNDDSLLPWTPSPTKTKRGKPKAVTSTPMGPKFVTRNPWSVLA